MDGMERWKRLGLVRVGMAGVESIGEKGRSQKPEGRSQNDVAGEFVSSAAGSRTRSVAGAGATGAGLDKPAGRPGGVSWTSMKRSRS